MESDTFMWALVLPLLGAVLLAAIAGFVVDRHRRHAREMLRTSDTQHARVMQDYYSYVHGAEA